MVLTIAHQKGGVGKSTIAANLAIACASKTSKLLVVDLDKQKIMSNFCRIRNSHSSVKMEYLHFDDDKKLIELLKNCKHDILIDCGGYDSKLTRIAMIGADKIITPVGSGMPELIGLKEFAKIVIDLQKTYPDLKANVFLNKIAPGAVKVITDIKEFFANYNKQFNFLDTIIRRRSDFELSMELGKSVVEMNKTSKAAEELLCLIKEIYV